MNDPKYPTIDSDRADLYRRFTYHAPHGDQAQRYERLRAEFRILAIVLSENCPKSRELSVALTHLDSAMFNANAAIARNEKKEGGS